MWPTLGTLGGKPWIRTISTFAASQGVAQFLGLVSGILIVRNLETASYAHYAVLTAGLAGYLLLSESGVTATVMVNASRLLQSNGTLSGLALAALRFRLLAGTVTAVPVFMFLFWILLLNEASSTQAISYLAFLTMAMFAGLVRGTIQVMLRAEKKYRALHEVALVMAALRLAAVGILIEASALTIISLLVLLSAELAVDTMLLLRRSSLTCASRRNLDESYDFVPRLKQSLLSNLSIVSQGQLLYLGLGLTGSVTALAHVAAMSKLALIFYVLNSIVTNIGSGHIAHVDGTVRSLARTYLISLLAFGGVAVILMTSAYVASPLLLPLMGSEFSGLRTPFLIILIGTGAINLADALRVLNQARGWLTGAWLSLPLTAVWFIIGIQWIDLRTTVGASIWMALQALPLLAAQITCTLRGFKAISRVVHDAC